MRHYEFYARSQIPVMIDTIDRNQQFNVAATAAQYDIECREVGGIPPPRGFLHNIQINIKKGFDGTYMHAPPSNSFRRELTSNVNELLDVVIIWKGSDRDRPHPMMISRNDLLELLERCPPNRTRIRSPLSMASLECILHVWWWLLILNIEVSLWKY